jgi:hypothetical protein
MAEETSRTIWERADTAASIVSKLLIPVVLLVVGHLLTAGLRDRETAMKESELERAWVQLALEVLRDEGLAEQREMRDWSVAVINYYVPDDIRISTGLREGLVEGRVSFPSPPSPERAEMMEIQRGLGALGICDGIVADGLAGPMTHNCVGRFLGDATGAEAMFMLTAGRPILLGWITAGATPPDWRQQAPGLPTPAVPGQPLAAP